MISKISIFVIILSLLFAFIEVAKACEGARPLALGGAFTGLADDANATYWNPAALGLIEKPELTYTGTAYDRDAYNYDDWASMVIPLDVFSHKDNANLGTLGLSFMNNIDKGKFSYLYYGIDINVDVEIDERWYTISYGREISEIAEGLCLGANLRYLTFEEALKTQFSYGGTTYQSGGREDDSLLALDLAVYYKWKKFSAGLLIQNANEPELTVFDVTGKYKANFRPGIAYRLWDKFIISTELYDATNDSNYRNFRIGAEAQITDNAAIRVGGYDITATDKIGRAITGGIGLTSLELTNNIDLNLSYGILYWYESEAEMRDKFSHLLAITATFDVGQKPAIPAYKIEPRRPRRYRIQRTLDEQEFIKEKQPSKRGLSAAERLDRLESAYKKGKISNKKYIEEKKLILQTSSE